MLDPEILKRYQRDHKAPTNMSGLFLCPAAKESNEVGNLKN